MSYRFDNETFAYSVLYANVVVCNGGFPITSLLFPSPFVPHSWFWELKYILSLSSFAVPIE